MPPPSWRGPVTVCNRYACGKLLIFGGRDAKHKMGLVPPVPPGGNAASKLADGTHPVHSLASLQCSNFPQRAALHLPGDSAMHVQVKAAPSLQRLQNCISLEAWVKPAGFATGAPIACKAASSAPSATALGFGLFALDEAAAKKMMADCVPDKLPNLSWWVSGCPARALICLELDAWSHVVGTWDGAMMHLYHNGVLADSVPYVVPSAEEAEALHTKGDFFVGAIPGKGAWDGLIDEVCLYAVAIDQTYVRRVMNSAVRSTGQRDDAVLGHWSFNEGAGDQCSDSSSNKNHGSLEGGTKRVLSTRVHMPPAMSASEKHVDAAFMELRGWKKDFEKKEGREPNRADFTMAEPR